MLKKMLLSLLIFFLGILVYLALTPDFYNYSRSLSIQVPPEKIFTWVNDLQKWKNWSSIQKLDPKMEGSLKDALEVVSAVPFSSILFRLKVDLLSEGERNLSFSFSPYGRTTLVTCELNGFHTYYSKVNAFFSGSKWKIENRFSESLSNLKTIVERGE